MNMCTENSEAINSCSKATSIQNHSFEDDSNDSVLQSPNNCTLNSDYIKKIYPSRTELSVINNSIKCTEEACQEIFTSYSNLNLHLYKTHKKKEAIQSDSGIKHYHCPETHCLYHQTQWFKNNKLLKQHYLKVHSPKIFICENCNEGFATKAYRNMHSDYCGVKFTCNDCPLSYPKYESLLTHARRKEHTIHEKIFFKLKKSSNITCSKSENLLLNKLKPILPKPVKSMSLLNSSNFMIKKSDQSIQTEHVFPKLKSKNTQVARNTTVLNKDTRQTQTGLWKEQLSIETQTIGDFWKRVKSEDKKFVKSATQTSLKSSKSVSSNTFFSMIGGEVPDSNIKRSSSSTQTVTESTYNNFPATTNTHDSIDSDTSDLIDQNFENFGGQYFNCNMETQTDCIFNEDLFDYGDYYSNMYTQTCEDLLLNSLELNNIETQTVDDMLKSVEIQTIMSQRKPQTNCPDISHMETQTDLEFKQMLEAIDV